MRSVRPARTAPRCAPSGDAARAEADRFIAEFYSKQRIIEAQALRLAELEAALAEANQRAALNEQAVLLLGQIEDRNTQTTAQLRIAATALGHLEEITNADL